MQRKDRLLYFISTILTNIDTILAFFIFTNFQALFWVKITVQFLSKIDTKVLSQMGVQG